MPRFQSLELFLLACLLVSKAVLSEDDGELLDKVLKWTRENGGYISEKIEIQHITGDLRGLFAKEKIEHGEVLTDIPWKLILRPRKGALSSWCETVQDVRSAIMKDPEAQTPYEKYLSGRSRTHVPQFWSKTSIELLQEMMEGCFPIHGLALDLDEQWLQSCESEIDSATLDAMMLLQTRGEGPNGMDFIPIHDLLNHRNGEHTNVDPEYNPNKSYRILATRDIEVGEQLQNSYNQCQWCTIYRNPSDADWFQVTPQLFELYGFIEFMPQRWVVPHVRLMFDIDEVEPDEADFPGELEVDFQVPPSNAGLHFLHQRLEFLEKMSKDIEKQSEIPKHEKDGLMTFYKSVKQAFSLAIEYSDDQVSDEVWHMGDYWYWEFDHDEIEEDDEDEDSSDEDDDVFEEDDDYDDEAEL